MKTSTLSNALLWFGASVSIAEILTGALFAPLGLSKGIAAIILGHIIGCTLFYFVGLIGAKSGKSAMESVGYSFGSKGLAFFSSLNILQLIGWTAVMILTGARAIGIILNPMLGISGELLWCILIGALILVWLAAGIKNVGKLNLIAVSALFVLSVLLGFTVFKSGRFFVPYGVMHFGAAVELSAAMPLSWLPLVSDYTRSAKKPKTATVVSTASYFIGSSFMYIIGLGAALYLGESDIAKIMLAAGLGMAGMLIVTLSTVTTTFLDVFSAGVSLGSITKKISEKKAAVLFCIIGTVIAIFTPVEQYENFLYLIGSVFAPMTAILITDFFLLKKDSSNEDFNKTNLIIWAAGFLFYRIFLNFATPLGSTLPVMVITSMICISVNKWKKLNRN